MTTVMRLATVLVAVVTAFLPLKAADVTVDSLFVTSPLKVLDILPREARASATANYRAGKPETSIFNRLYSLSEIDSLTDNYLKITLTDASDLTINLIEDRKHQPVVVTVYTVGAPGVAKDSDIEFYDAEWKPLERKKLWEPPKVKDFFAKPKDDRVDLKKIEELIPFPTYTLEVSSDGLTVTGRLTVDTYLSEEAKTEIKPYLVPSRTWRWDGKKYKLERVKN